MQKYYLQHTNGTWMYVLKKVNVGDAQHPNYVTAVGLYILRENKNVKIDLIGDRTHESFTQSSYVAVRHGTIGTDTKKNCY